MELSLTLACTKICEPINLKIPVRRCVWAIIRNDQAVRRQGLPRVTAEHITLDENLIVAAAMNGLIVEIFIEIIIHMLMSKAASWTSRARVLPVIVMVRNMQMTYIDVSERIRVADKARLPVVMKVVPRDCDPVASSYDVALAVVIIRTMIDVRFKLVVINPHTRTVLDGDAVVVENETDS